MQESCVSLMCVWDHCASEGSSPFHSEADRSHCQEGHEAEYRVLHDGWVCVQKFLCKLQLRYGVAELGFGLITKLGYIFISRQTYLLIISCHLQWLSTMILPTYKWTLVTVVKESTGRHLGPWLHYSMTHRKSTLDFIDWMLVIQISASTAFIHYLACENQ